MKMKKILAAVMAAACFLTSCSSKIIEFDNVNSILNGKEMQEKYEHLNFSDEYEIEIPDGLYIYNVSTNNVDMTNDNKIRAISQIITASDDFDNSINKEDDIVTEKSNDNGGTIIIKNNSKDMELTVSKNGTIIIEKESSELLSILNDESNRSKCVFANSKNISEKYKKLLEKADVASEKLSKIYGNFKLKAQTITEFKAENKYYYEITYAMTIDDLSVNPFGIFSDDNVIFSEHNTRIYLDGDENVNVIYSDALISYTKDKEISKAVTLQSALNYIDKELAPNYDIDIRSVSLEYARLNYEKRFIPVWDIEFSDGTENIQNYNRIFINVEDGKAYSYIDGIISEIQE